MPNLNKPIIRDAIKPFPLLTVLLLLLFTTPIFAISPSFSYSGSLRFTTGSYFFSERTETLYFINSLGYSGDWGSIQMNLPFVVQNSPWISYSEGGVLPTGGKRHGQVGNSSHTSTMRDTFRQRRHRVDVPPGDADLMARFGDPGLNATYRIYDSWTGNTSLQLNGSVKIPLTNPNYGFGTGAWDFGIGLSGMQRLRYWFVTTDVMYWHMGNMEDLELNNPLTGSLGIGYAFGDTGWLMSGSIYGSTPILDDFDPPANLLAGVGYMYSHRTSINGSVSFGLTNSSADLSIGFGWLIRL